LPLLDLIDYYCLEEMLHPVSFLLGSAVTGSAEPVGDGGLERRCADSASMSEHYSTTVKSSSAPVDIYACHKDEMSISSP